MMDDDKKVEANKTLDHTKANLTSSSDSPEDVKPQPSLAERLKVDWYQTESQVVLTIFLRNTKISNVNVEITEEQALCTAIFPETGEPYKRIFNFLHVINPLESSWKLHSTKIEIKLKKSDCLRWCKLERQPLDIDCSFSIAPSMAAPPSSDTTSSTQAEGKGEASAIQKRDWDKLAVEIAKEEESEKAEGESALNQLFQKIYGEGSDDVKRAMNKSFMESGGTVLSTNWKDIAQKKTDVKPPDGMEWKQWD